MIDLRDQSAINHLARLNRDLRGALRRGELEIHYQPIVRTESGRIVGAEALLRWAHPAFGLIKPDVVIPLAEQSGLIAEIGHWVMTQACLDRRRWQGYSDHENIGVSINVSVDQLMTHDFTDTVLEVLADTDTEANLVTLEVTESVIMADKARVLSVLRALKSHGVMLALDDFGTGQSSLSHVKQLPVDALKMDREFVADIGSNPASRIILGAVVRLAHGLGMGVTAEGVENVRQYDEVAALKCDFSQGFYFSQPVEANRIDDMLASGHSLPAHEPLLGVLSRNGGSAVRSA